MIKMTLFGVPVSPGPASSASMLIQVWEHIIIVRAIIMGYDLVTELPQWPNQNKRVMFKQFKTHLHVVDSN